MFIKSKYHRSNDTYKDKFRWSDKLFQDNWVSPCSDFQNRMRQFHSYRTHRNLKQ